MPRSLKLTDTADLESVVGAVILELPSGKRLWVCPEESIEDAVAFLSEAGVREDLEKAIAEAEDGDLIDVDLPEPPDEESAA